MRTKEKILEDSAEPNNFYDSILTVQALTLEVLLDIRELLIDIKEMK